MPAWLAAGAGAVALGDLWLAAVCWRLRTALGGAAAIVGLGLVAFAAARGAAGAGAQAAVLIALLFLVLGTALLGLGRLLTQLLDNPPDERDP